MAQTIKIIVERCNEAKLEVLAELNDSRIAGLVGEALPITSAASIWGDEVYFGIPVRAGLENPRDTVEQGDLGYWPEGPALCIFFGPTPISSPGEIRPASAVDVVGRLLGKAQQFRMVRTGDTVKLKEAEDIE